MVILHDFELNTDRPAFTAPGLSIGRAAEYVRGHALARQTKPKAKMTSPTVVEFLWEDRHVVVEGCTLNQLRDAVRTHLAPRPEREGEPVWKMRLNEIKNGGV